MSTNLETVRKLQKAYCAKDLEAFKTCVTQDAMAYFLNSGEEISALDNLMRQVESNTHRPSKELEALECGDLITLKLKKTEGDKTPYIITYRVTGGKVSKMWLNQ